MQSCALASRPPSRPGGRFRHRAHFAVTRGALSRLAPSWSDELMSDDEITTYLMCVITVLAAVACGTEVYKVYVDGCLSRVSVMEIK
ncbi:hypothetical protein NDU88_001559 [Pleurodeles waltl]|uniref:Uncharacterized protein n=1 Tax=Pleurodeles waltl TaxID=8319 RepID=A0AAV7NBI0_PLEWA|nr:hypothetical protein NDU88_001559 [Pleurodeles waltl]